MLPCGRRDEQVARLLAEASGKLQLGRTAGTPREQINRDQPARDQPARDQPGRVGRPQWPAELWQRGTLVECFSRGWGTGAAGFALWMACQACGPGGRLVVVDPRGWCYPPALIPWGIRWSQICIIRPANQAELLWVVDQALRCEAIGAVWAEIDQLAPHPFRRLQLAAEQGAGWGVLVRPARAQGQPSWAQVQLAVRPRSTSANAAEPPGSQHPAGDLWPLQLQQLRWRGTNGPTELSMDVDFPPQPVFNHG